MEATLNTTEIERYPAYKDSGIEWLREIPEHWNIRKIKFVSNVFNGDSLNDNYKKKFESINLNDLAYISSKDIDVNTAEINYENGLRIPLEEKKYKIAPKDTSLVCIEGGSAGRKIAFVNQKVCFVNKLACFNPYFRFHSKFIYYSLRGSQFQIQFKLAMSGLIGGVAISSINNFSLLLPPLPEQTAIANFLDRKTAQVDTAIRIKERQIELLKERRQILIHKAVTRGLHWDSSDDRMTGLDNPKIQSSQKSQFRHSGVDWIGEIPAHWEVASNRSLFAERNEPGNDSLPILSVSIHTAVSSEELSDDENLRGKIRIEDKSSYKLVNVNDITFNMMRAWQGAIGAVRVKGMVSPAYVVAKPIGSINADFFEYQYRSKDFIQQMDRHSKGITDFRKRLYWHEFKQLKTAVPPLNEQNEIVEFISRLSTKVEAAISLKQKEIVKLKEYKATLINSAVTGKIKVS
jgi:type I restriction enzyme S subunit